MASAATHKTAVNDLRIRLSDPSHLETWAERLGVSEDELRRAIQRAGTWAPAVEKQLTGQASWSATRPRDEGLRASP
jgi:hypothetical protein